MAATRCSDTSQRQIASCVLENFCENPCLRNIVLSLQQVAKNQIRQNLCELLLRQNSVAGTKIFTKILLHTRSDLSLRRVAVTCCCNLSPDLYTWSDLSPRLVAATCCPVCTDLYKCVQLVQGEIMLISITITFFLILKKTSQTSFFFFETSKLVSPQFFLFTLFCFREKKRRKNLTTNLNKFCLHAVAGFATHCANRHGALHPRSKV